MLENVGFLYGTLILSCAKAFIDVSKKFIARYLAERFKQGILSHYARMRACGGLPSSLSVRLTSASSNIFYETKSVNACQRG